MAIEAEIPVTLARVDWTDDHMVTLKQRRRKVAFTPLEARQLADELRTAADEADDALRAEAAAHNSQERALAAHGFDADGPIHPECRDGKCRNCDGRTLNGRDDMVPCVHECHREGASA
jgi:hypothetical protein